MKKSYYLDSCIWLNLFKKEGDASKGIPYWKIALDFIKDIESNGCQVYVSTIVLKELYFAAPKKFRKIKEFFKQNSFVEVVKTDRVDYDLARDFENEDNAKISFYDYLHIAIVKRLGCFFVTRDEDLIYFAKDKVTICKPENLIG